MIDVFLVKRWCRHLWQRLARGWDDSDTWSLDHTAAKWLLPRLLRFKELNIGYPANMTPKEWDAILDDIIYAMNIIAHRWEGDTEDTADWDRVHHGCGLFGCYFQDLWW